MLVLFEKYLELRDLMVVDVVDVEVIIKSVGLFYNKVCNIIKMVCIVYEELVDVVFIDCKGIMVLLGVGCKIVNVVLSDVFE